MRKFVVGNWKMNGTRMDISILSRLQQICVAESFQAKVAVCVPFTLLSAAVETGVAVGAQNCHTQISGAYTGEVSAMMLKDIGANYVIIGHSERRTAMFETNEIIAEKSNAASHAGIHAILCVGESLLQRENGSAVDLVAQQLLASLGERTVPELLTIAYEPIWAIGTGKTPTLQEIAQMHATIRNCLLQRFGDFGQSICIQYGGSVKPENANTLSKLPNLDGFLVGGASLNLENFLPIIRVYN